MKELWCARVAVCGIFGVGHLQFVGVVVLVSCVWELCVEVIVFGRCAV